MLLMLRLSAWAAIPLSGLGVDRTFFDPSRKWRDLTGNEYILNISSAVFAPPITGKKSSGL